MKRQTPNKFSTGEYRAYWQGVHASTEDDLAAVCFPGKSKYFNRFFHRTQVSALESAFRSTRLDWNGKAILDVGCGRGRWMHHLAVSHGALTQGIDLSADAIEACHVRGLDAKIGSVTDLPFADATFDGVLSITVLLHLPPDEKRRGIHELGRVLKNGGHAVILENTYPKDPSPHVFGLSVSEWTQAFGEQGMRLIYSSPLYFNWIRRHLPSLRGLTDDLAITLDYPIDYALMWLLRGRSSRLGLQHVLIYRK